MDTIYRSECMRYSLGVYERIRFILFTVQVQKFNWNNSEFNVLSGDKFLLKFAKKNESAEKVLSTLLCTLYIIIAIWNKFGHLYLSIPKDPPLMAICWDWMKLFLGK